MGGWRAGSGRDARGSSRRALRGRAEIVLADDRHFLVELLAELPRHRARPARPAADLVGEFRQFFRPQHQERDAEDQDDLGEADLEHRPQVFLEESAPSRSPLPELKSASGASCASFLPDSSSSPSLMDFLKPRTAAPRSEPMLRSFFAPKIRSAIARMIRSSRNPIPMSMTPACAPGASRS